ncbi:MAG: arsenic efflux protein [Clostridium sp.]|nr:arsenic efflux protein [Clostridium sp.]MCM1444438.1 arsenic efflux protein [Candidatus Amulumruptor caecigallinarius]
MKDILIDTLIDGLKLLPFLFLTFLLMEYIEHKLSNKTKDIIQKSGRFGPIIGSILGVFPQCGFSVSATNLYAARVITLGTLISIYLSTSDEMLPLLISNGTSINIILPIVLLKVVIGMFFGFIIDLIFRKTENEHIHDFCEEEHCDCKSSIFLSTLKHTLNTFLFILLVTFILNLVIHFIGEENLGNIILKNGFLGPIFSSLIGLIPNCASSVIITELYLNGVITFGSMLSGLLTGSGVALLVLFKVNKNLKENFKILSIIYLIGVISGIVAELINLI